MFIGIDFGTLSVRGILYDPATRAVVESCTVSYEGNVIELDDGGCVFDDAETWVRAGEQVLHTLASELQSSNQNSACVKAVGVTFTSCTVVPLRSDGTQVQRVGVDDPRKRPHACAKMWKHHSPGAQKCADDLTREIKRRNESWIDEHYGGNLGLEWFFPKALQVFDEDRQAFEDTHCFVEGGDFVVWALSGRKLPVEDHLIRSNQQGGYKGCFVSGRSLITTDHIRSIRSDFSRSDFAKMDIARFPTRSPSKLAGNLITGSPFSGIPLSVASIDAHACAFGLGAFRKGRLVLVVGTSGCYMLSADPPSRPLKGAAGFIPEGIAAGLHGYEFGQSAVGDCFAWLSRFTNVSLPALEHDARNLLSILQSENRELECWAVDHLNGCRTPLMRGDMKGSIHGLTLGSTPAHSFLALMESVCFGIRVVVEMLQKGEIGVNQVALAGGLAKSELFCQILATAIGQPVRAMDDGGDATARGAACYAANMFEGISNLGRFEPHQFRDVSPSKSIRRVLAGDIRFERYVDAAKVRSYI